MGGIMEKRFSGKTITAILAIASAVVLFLFSTISVAQDIAAMTRGDTSVYQIVPFVLSALPFLFSLAAIVLNALALRKPQDERIFGLITVILSTVAAFAVFSVDLIVPLIRGYFRFPALSFAELILTVAFLAAYLVCNAKFPRATLAQTQSTAAEGELEPTTLPADSAQAEDGYLSFPLHVLCMLFFGFIWKFVWIYKVTRFLNTKTKFNRDTTVTLLLAIFVPFYTVYWTYKAAREINGLQQKERSQIAAICLILCFIFPVAPPLLMQWALNKYSEQEHGKKETPQEPRATIAEDLKRYKELLDEGAITQDEYDKIKSKYLSSL